VPGVAVIARSVVKCGFAFLGRDATHQGDNVGAAWARINTGQWANDEQDHDGARYLR
jgi:hypothetical protein